jgi:hypothetical protein
VKLATTSEPDNVRNLAKVSTRLRSWTERLLKHDCLAAVMVRPYPSQREQGNERWHFMPGRPFGPSSGAITAAVAIFSGETEASARRIGTGGINWDELWELQLDDVLNDRVPTRSTALTIEAKNLLMPYRQTNGFFGRGPTPTIRDQYASRPPSFPIYDIN